MKRRTQAMIEADRAAILDAIGSYIRREWHSPEAVAKMLGLKIMALDRVKHDLEALQRAGRLTLKMINGAPCYKITPVQWIQHIRPNTPDSVVKDYAKANGWTVKAFGAFRWKIESGHPYPYEAFADTEAEAWKIVFSEIREEATRVFQRVKNQPVTL